MPFVACLRALPPLEHLPGTPGPLASPQQTLCHTPADSACDCSSTDRCRWQTTRFGCLRPRTRRQSSPPPRWWPKRRHLAALAARRAVRLTRAAALVSRSRRRTDLDRRLVPEATQKLREGAGAASSPPQTPWSMGEQLGEQRRPREPRRSRTLLGPCGAYRLTFVHVECMCVVYTNVVHDASQPCI